MTEETLEAYKALTEENKIKFDLFVARLVEKQGNYQPLPDSRA